MAPTVVINIKSERGSVGKNTRASNVHHIKAFNKFPATVRPDIGYTIRHFIKKRVPNGAKMQVVCAQGSLKAVTSQSHEATAQEEMTRALMR